MTELLEISLPLRKKINEELNEKIKSIIENNQKEFQELFEALIDNDDSRTIVLDDSLIINEVILTTPNDGVAYGEFDSHFYSGCKDMDSRDEHEVTLPFRLDDNSIHFEMEIPESWRPM